MPAAVGSALCFGAFHLSEHLHEVLRRDVTEVRMLLDHLERYVGSVSAAQRLQPDVARAFDAIRLDLPARQPDEGYVRPDRSTMTYVPDHTATLLS